MNVVLPPVVCGRATLTRSVRCLSVSVGTTLLSSAILVAFAVGAGVPAGTANFVAVACGIPPSYFGNRRWVWRHTGRGSITREVLPFWVMSLGALVLSTLFVGRIGSVTATWAASTRSIVLPVANIGVFGALWLVQFAVLDRVIFRDRAAKELLQAQDQVRAQ